MLLYDKNANLLVVADYKHSMTPVGPAEVSNRSKDHLENLKQMKRYLDFFKRFPKTIESVFDSHAENLRIRAVLLYRSPMPIPVAADAEVVVADWTTFSSWISLAGAIAKQSGVDLDKALDSYVSASQFSSNNHDWKVETIETLVGEWKYIHEMFVVPQE